MNERRGSREDRAGKKRQRKNLSVRFHDIRVDRLEAIQRAFHQFFDPRQQKMGLSPVLRNSGTFTDVM